MLDVLIPGTPVPQGSHTVMRGRLVPVRAKELYAWREAAEAAVRKVLPDGWDTSGAFHAFAVFQLPRPKSHYMKSGRLRKGAPDEHTGRPDLDKLQRSLGDALTRAGAFQDDAQIVHWEAWKNYAADGGTRLLLRRLY